MEIIGYIRFKNEKSRARITSYNVCYTKLLRLLFLAGFFVINRLHYGGHGDTTASIRVQTRQKDTALVDEEDINALFEQLAIDAKVSRIDVPESVETPFGKMALKPDSYNFV